MGPEPPQSGFDPGRRLRDPPSKTQTNPKSGNAPEKRSVRGSRALRYSNNTHSASY